MLWLLGITVGIVLLVLGWREYALRRLPYDDLEIPAVVEEKRLEIPPRPGVQGVVITGPRIEPLFFAIDLSMAGVRELNWRRLRLVDPHADVKLTCTVDGRGRLLFSQEDVLMEGHTEAGMMIQQALKTWVYTPYKSGMIRFWFNLPSKGKKLIIDTQGLRRKGEVPGHVPIYDGRLYLIEGIPNQDVQVGGQV